MKKVFASGCDKRFGRDYRKGPRYLVDLLLGEATLPKKFEPEAWHKELEVYMAAE